MALLERPLEQYESVKVWFEGLHDQSGVDAKSDPSRLALLEEFCIFTDLDPDQMVKACLLVKEGRETRISIKGRRTMAEKIAEFQAKTPSLDSAARARRGNIIRSFLIHNGILLQSGVQI